MVKDSDEDEDVTEELREEEEVDVSVDEPVLLVVAELGVDDLTCAEISSPYAGGVSPYDGSCIGVGSNVLYAGGSSGVVYACSSGTVDVDWVAEDV